MNTRISRKRNVATSLTFAATLFLCASLNAQKHSEESGGWSQILGSTRNGHVQSKTKFDWTEAPETLWQKEIGAGFSGPVLHGKDLVIFHRPGSRPGMLAVEKLKADTGDLIWKREIPTRFRAGIDGDAGPKATPLISGDHVFCYGPDGELFCLKMNSGEVVWQVDVRKKFGVSVGYFGCGSSPIVVGDLLLLNVGGRDDSSIVAFNKLTGEVEWNAVQDGPSYSSPIIVGVDSTKVAVFLTRTRLIGIDAASGKVLFSKKFGKRGPTAIGAMPVRFDETKVFVTAAYQCGAMVIDLSDLDAKSTSLVNLKPVWKDADAFASHYATPVFLNGYFYGSTGREDIGNGSFRCIDATNGRVKWDEANFPVGHTLIRADQLLVLDHQGKLNLLKATPDKFQRVKACQVFDGMTRSIPAFADGRLFFRSNANNGKATLKAIKVAEIPN